MAVHDRFPLELRRGKIRRAFLQKFAEQECLLREPLRVLIVREKIAQFVAKRATQLGSRPTTGCPRGFLRAARAGFVSANASRYRASRNRRAGVRSRVDHRHDHVEAGLFEHFDRVLCGARVEVIVEGVRPENDLRFACVPRPALCGTTP